MAMIHPPSFSWEQCTASCLEVSSAQEGHDGRRACGLPVRWWSFILGGFTILLLMIASLSIQHASSVPACLSLPAPQTVVLAGCNGDDDLSDCLAGVDTIVYDYKLLLLASLVWEKNIVLTGNLNEQAVCCWPDKKELLSRVQTKTHRRIPDRVKKR